MMPAIESHPVGREYGRASASRQVASDALGAEWWRRNRKICLLDSPLRYVDVMAPLWWSGNADSSSTVLQPVPGPLPDPPRDDGYGLVSTEDQIALVVHSLGFSKRQLAEVFGVSRQAIYDWLKGGNVSEDNAERLLKIARLVAEISATTKRPLHHRFTTRSLSEGEPSLLDMLRAEAWDEGRIRVQLRRARNLTAQHTAHRGSGGVERSQERRDEILSDNLLSLGVE